MITFNAAVVAFTTSCDSARKATMAESIDKGLIRLNADSKIKNQYSAALSEYKI